MQIAFKDGKTKALTLSYDDGVYQDIRLVEIMNKYKIKGTFNINSGSYCPENYIRKEPSGRLKLSEAKDLYVPSGHEIAVHGLTHPWIATLKESEITYEVMQDRLNLEREFGVIVRGMAYPFGCCNDKTDAVLKSCGIVYSRTTVATENFTIPENWLRMPATCHHNNPKLKELTKRFTNENCYFGQARLFYLWGHSYEFDNNDNWNVIEDFCAEISEREDIWYATNIEIYDYVQSYKNLITSADGKTVYNPNANPVWFFAGDEIIKVDPKQTVSF